MSGRVGVGWWSSRAAYARLATISGRDMLRNPLSGLSMLFMFVVIVAIYVSMWVTFTVLGASPTVAVIPADVQVSQALEQAGVAVVDPGVDDRNAEVRRDGDRVSVVLDGSARPAWNSIWVALRDAGFSAHAITVVDDRGDVRLDPLRAYLGVAAMTAISSAAFIGLTVPLVGMRERGLLRLFGTTPLRRSTFLLAQVPARFVVVLVEVLIIVVIAVWRRYVDGLDVVSLAVTVVTGSSMLFALALVFAGRSRNAEATQQGMAMLTILLVFASGGIVPPSALPVVAQAAMNALPTTWFVAAVNADLTGADSFVPLPVLWLFMGLGACGALLLAARRFEWDQSEPRQPTPTGQRRKVTP
ncbi:ABC transporter permease [Microbacterium lushaniae]|uniref:ABC transporter permease n=1 Tax=Microbacterium lushaniae TaxID=2614639 RepID=A0A5J6L3A9_9MICO|nr:ABC transporter permease [Microbacterium lushaniae]QEW03024.1 ABC transporter permease [Microbacterium lushaniae]